MRENPYAPPKGALSEVSPELSLKKPIAVWLFQILAALLATTLLVGIARVAIFDLQGTQDWKVPLVAVTWRLAAFALLAAGLVGSQQRALYGRIVGALCISLLAIAAAVNQVVSTYKSGASLSSSAGSAAAVGEMFALFLIIGLFWWWLYSYSFSARAKLYFHRSRNASHATDA